MTVSKTSRAITRRVFTPRRDEALAALSVSYEAEQAEHRGTFWLNVGKTAQRLESMSATLEGRVN